jgi:hypothetical protein
MPAALQHITQQQQQQGQLMQTLQGILSLMCQICKRVMHQQLLLLQPSLLVVLLQATLAHL